MMDFVIMTLSFMVGTLMASGLAFMVMMNPKVLKWYMYKVQKITEEVLDQQLDEYFQK